VEVEAKIVAVIEEAHWEHHNILANTLAWQAYHHLHLEQVEKLPMILCSLQVDTKARALENLTQEVQAEGYES